MKQGFRPDGHWKGNAILLCKMDRFKAEKRRLGGAADFQWDCIVTKVPDG